MEDDSGWILDSVVQYLVSPIWQTPVLGFLDSKCIVFDPDDCKENEKAYREIHEEYKTTVQFLLDSFLEDIGINGDQFVEACKKSGNDRPEAVMNAFEQVEAARNYKLFKSMMMKRNVDLELQALQMIQSRNGVIPEILKPGSDTSIEYSQSMVDSEEDKILQEALKRSQEEYEAEKARKSKEIDHDMEKALANSKEEADRLAHRKKEEEAILSKVLSQSKVEEDTRKTTESEKQLREKTLNMTISDNSKSSSLPPVSGTKPKSSSSTSKSPSSSKSPPPSTSKSPPPSSSKSPTPSGISNADAAANWLSSAKAEAATEPGRTSRASAMSGTDPIELKKREEYLKKQREKILAMKQEERKKSLQAYTASDTGAKARPKSARAAKQVTAGEMKVENKSDAEQQKQLAMRKALAERLKQEVVNKK